MATPSLYLIGTPLGNLEDITLRAQKMLQTLNQLFAEDTRELSKLLNLLGISLEGKKLHAYAAHNMKSATELALKILESEPIGLVSDRGMPAISDPGAYLVHAVRERQISVVPVPGPTAVTTLFAVSGITEPGFHFIGFLPTTQKARVQLWKSIQQWPAATCFYESPRRILETLKELSEWFPEGTVVIGREMTKQFEEFIRIPLKAWDKTPLTEKGEFTVILEPGQAPVTESDWQSVIQARLLSDKEWSKHVAEDLGCTASEIYNALQKAKK